MDLNIITTNESHISQIINIYSYYILNTPVTFEVEIPEYNEFKNRVDTIQEKYPFLSALIDNKVVGYAYAAPLKTRKAYEYSCETTIYLDYNYKEKSIGKALYTRLFEYLKKQNIVNLYACITESNKESIIFHEKFGFQKTAHFHKCGFKHNKWHDVMWFEKIISDHSSTPKPFINFNNIKP